MNLYVTRTDNFSNLNVIISFAVIERVDSEDRPSKRFRDSIISKNMNSEIQLRDICVIQLAGMLAIFHPKDQKTIYTCYVNTCRLSNRIFWHLNVALVPLTLVFATFGSRIRLAYIFVPGDLRT